MKLKLLLFTLLTALSLSINAQSWIWGRSAWGGLGAGEAYGLTTDNAGNIYQCGHFNADTITFDSITFLVNSGTGNTKDIFLVKYDPSGNVLWAKSLGATGQDGAYSVVCDQSNSVYVVGYFQAPGFIFGNDTLTGAASGKMLLVKYDSAGNELWARCATGSGSSLGYGVTIDNSGNIFITGSFSTGSITLGSTTLTNGGQSDAFLVKYDPAGNVLWARKAGSTSFDEGMSMVVDQSGNAYMSGMFTGTVAFGSVTLTSNGLSDLYIAKYDPSGTVLWAISAGGTSYEAAKCIAIDQAGDLYITGWYRSPSVVFPTVTLTNSSTSVSDNDAFLAKYDNSGNELWAKSIGGVEDESGFYCATSFGSVFFAGSSESSSVVLDSTTFTLPLQWSEAWYFLQCDFNGNDLSATTVNTGDQSGSTAYGAIACSNSGDVYFGGAYKADSVIFNFDTLRTTFGGGSHNSFLAKYVGISTGLSNVDHNRSIPVYPNPSHDIFYMSMEWPAQTPANIEVVDMLGNVIYQDAFTGNNYILDLSDKSTGVYFYRVSSANETFTGKILLQ